jgi:ATP-binding cassette subfamily B protein
MSAGALLRRFWRQCSPRRRLQLLVLLGLMLASAVAEVVSLGAVLPFIGVLLAPERWLARPGVASLLAFAGVGSGRQAVFALTGLFIAAAVLAALVRMALVWFNYRFTAAFGAELAESAYRRALGAPYAEHLQRHSATLVSLIARKVDVCVNGGVIHLLFLASALVQMLAVVAALLWIDARLALLSAAVVALFYVPLSWLVRRRLLTAGRVAASAQDETVRALQEGFGGLREILLAGTQAWHSRLFGIADRRMRRAQGMAQFTGGAPRYLLEALGIALLASLAAWLSVRDGGLAAALPSLAALALGAQRLLPAAQLAFNSWTHVSGNAAAMSDTLELLEQPEPAHETESAPPLPLTRALALREVHFRYTPAGPDVLCGVDLQIARGARIGFVGASGSGKSTLMDVLMGLLVPTSGALVVDERTVDPTRLPAWRRSIAHVPQALFLADGSFTENIAFGVPPAEVDAARVREAARQACIAELIERAPEGYAARVGERGVRLSGGQRQRVGIARALYRRAQVLVLDEATSALDAALEQGVLESIAALDRSVTVLIIAHRESTLAACDQVYELVAGRCQRRR